MLLAACAASVMGDEPPPLSIDGIARIYEDKQSKLQSIRIEYSVTGSRSIPRGDYFAKFRNLEPPRSDLTEIIVGERIYAKRVVTRKPIDKVQDELGLSERQLDERQLDELSAAVDASEPVEMVQETFFDGEIVRSLQPYSGTGRKEYTIDAPIAAPYRCTGLFYLDYVGLGPKDPCIHGSGKDEAYGRLAAMLRAAEFSLSTTTEKVSGADCVVARAAGYVTVWLDPTLAYAVRRIAISRDDRLRSIADCGHFQEVVDDLWIPRQIEIQHYDKASSDAAKPTVVQTLAMNVTELQVNRSDLSGIFERGPEPGSLVTDRRVGPRDKPEAAPTVGAPGALGGRPVVVYEQPADAQDVDAAIAEAKRYAEAGELPPWIEGSELAKERASGSYQRKLLAIGGVVVGCALCLIAAVVAAKRKRGEGSETKR